MFTSVKEIETDARQKKLTLGTRNRRSAKETDAQQARTVTKVDSVVDFRVL
jgi:hypothetical protein